MVRLDSAAREAIRLAEKIAKSENKTRKNNKKFWKGKKIIPIEKHIKNVSLPTAPDYLQYMPDTFTPVPFFDNPEDEKTRQARSEWYKDYLEFLESKKDPAYGRDICEDCILNPSLDRSSKYLREMILNAYQEDATQPTYPCDVCNFFECPYKEERSKTLVFLGGAWQILDSALDCARNTTVDFDRVYRIDFDRGIAGRYNFGHELNNIKIQQILDNIYQPYVPLRDIVDFYNIFVNPELLDKVLEQYVRSIENEPVYDFDHNIWKKPTLRNQPQQLKKNKLIIKFFNMIKDTIKIENLHPYGRTLEEEARLKQESLEDKKKWELANPELAKEWAIKSGSCTVCTKVTKIYCVNCKIWMCSDHWREHAIQVHKIELVQVHS